MEFIILAKDGTDAEAPARRLAARPMHLEALEKFKNLGHIVYAGALLSDGGTMIGSGVIVEFESEEAMRKDWLENEPYYVNNVWQDITILPYASAAMFRE